LRTAAVIPINGGRVSNLHPFHYMEKGGKGENQHAKAEKEEAPNQPTLL